MERARAGMAKMSGETAFATMAISLMVIAACCLVVIAGCAIAVWLAVKRARGMFKSFQPPIAQATELLKAATEAVQAAKSGTEGLMQVAQDTALDLSERVKRTVGLAEDAVSVPLTSFATVMAGLSKAVQKLREPAETVE